VLSTLKNLMMDGSVYGEFASHVLNSGILHDKFFELDENFSPTVKNLNYHLSYDSNGSYNMMGMSNVDNYIKEEDLIKSEIKKMEKQAQELYKKSNANIGLNIKGLNEDVSQHIRKKIGPEVCDWIEGNLNNLSDEEYGNFMVYIASHRNK